MNDRNDSKRDDPRPRVQPSPDNAPPPAEEQTPKAREGAIRHIIDTGLPPGIRVDEAKDPGAKPPHGPADDRS
jgi:hypothetical protein